MSDNFIHLLIVLGALSGAAPTRPVESADKPRSDKLEMEPQRKKGDVEKARRAAAQRDGRVAADSAAAGPPKPSATFVR